MTKKVRFQKGTVDPPIPEKCRVCGHRNIIPKIREMEVCRECYKQACEECVTGLGMCAECLGDLLGCVGKEDNEVEAIDTIWEELLLDSLKLQN